MSWDRQKREKNYASFFDQIKEKTNFRDFLHLRSFIENLETNSKPMEANNQIDVISMVIWLSTGNGKFFELVKRKRNYFRLSDFSLLCFSRSTDHARQFNKFYRKSRKTLFDGVITILQRTLNEKPILKLLKPSSKQVSASRAHQVQELRVFYVLNTFSSDEDRHEE